MRDNEKTANTVMKRQGKAMHPERILQIGGGNFLRGFVGWIVDILNENGLDAGIVIARPTPSRPRAQWAEQEYLYTTVMRGYDAQAVLREEKRVISSVNRELSTYRDFEAFLEVARNPEIRFVFSNTTEAGIAFNAKDRRNDIPPATFPAKMTRFLYERFTALGGTAAPGLIFLPCELIDDNGAILEKWILKYAETWALEKTFIDWIKKANIFCSTLVDRIVSGFPEEDFPAITRELGYEDRFMVAGEYDHLFVIQGPESVGRELALDGCGLNIHLVEDLEPYKKRKIAILNGCHTTLAAIGLLAGIDTVHAAVSEPRLAAYLDRMTAREIIPCLNLPADSLSAYAAAVIERFRNPFIRHRLQAIALNAMSKFKTRLLPQLLKFHRENKAVPPLLSLALAALICLYRGRSEGRTFALTDEARFMDRFSALWGAVGKGPLTLDQARGIAEAVLSLQDHWGIDLTAVDGLPEKIGKDILSIGNEGMMKTLEAYLR